MIMESGFSSPRSETFPAGLRVLVVDDDPTWLKILEKMLKKCSYEVTTCGLAREALKLLRDRKDGFDIVISDVNMPDMNGFKLLEHVGLEMDLPVIMMSVDGETSRVMKGVQHGACDYLLKPIRMKELKNIWQHVLRKRMHEVREIECIEDRDHFNEGLYIGDQISLKKRKDVESKHDEKDSSDTCSTKKARVVWSVELHQKFVEAVNQIGIDSDKVGPKKILDLMNVPRLTRENVASHLQKYRLYLSRIRKEDKTESSFGGMKNPDHSSSDTSGNFIPRKSIDTDLKSSELLSSTEHSKLDVDLQFSELLPLTEHRKPFSSENSFGCLETSINYAPFDSPVGTQYPWSGEISDLQFGADLLEPALHINRGPSISDSDNSNLIDIKPLSVNPSGNNIGQLSPIERALDSFFEPNHEAFCCASDIKQQAPSERSIQSFSLHSKSHHLNTQGLEPNFNVTLDMKNPSSSQDNINGQASVIGFESEQRNPVFGSEDLMFCWLQGGDYPSKDLGFDYVGFSDLSFPDFVCEPPPVPKLGLDYDYLFDRVEYPVVDQGLLFSFSSSR